MRREVVSGVLLTVGVVSLSLVASQQAAGVAQQDAKIIEVERVRDNLFVLRGGGGNTAVFVGTDGVVVVDTKNPGWGQAVLDKIRELTGQPITTIINTHTHGDHVSGNVEFPPTVDVVTHANTAANMQRMQPASGIAGPPTGSTIFAQHNGRGLPTRTYTDRLTLGSGAGRIDLFYFGRGHTNGDTWVVFPSLRVAHAGDLFPNKQVPLIDGNNGGSGVAYPETLSQAHAGLQHVDTVVTGHGPLMTLNDLREYAEFNRDFLLAMQEAKQAGRTIDEMAATWTIPAKYVGYAAPQPARLRSNIEVVFRELP
jgi:glyoxylase-like metal-dependent hydrolase (beta-lactamase superfamily II)